MKATIWYKRTSPCKSNCLNKKTKRWKKKKKNHVNVTHKTQAQRRPDSGEGGTNFFGRHYVFSSVFSHIKHFDGFHHFSFFKSLQLNISINLFPSSLSLYFFYFILLKICPTKRNLKFNLSKSTSNMLLNSKFFQGFCLKLYLI